MEEAHSRGIYEYKSHPILVKAGVLLCQLTNIQRLKRSVRSIPQRVQRVTRNRIAQCLLMI
jgi:tetrahydromethanopterin S-methyltransferase subunit F